MTHENPTWGAPQHPWGTVETGSPCFGADRLSISFAFASEWHVNQRWRTFLKNHQESIAGMDFFTVMTANFRILYCLFLIRHDRREIIHFNSTQHPTSAWIVQQLREAFPNSTEDQYLLFDRDAKFGAEVVGFLDSCGISSVRTSYWSPWQNGVAERWVRNIRNELLDHVIVLNERHLRRLAQDYLRYYHEDRTHDGLNTD
jgi:putative transposase